MSRIVLIATAILCLPLSAPANAQEHSHPPPDPAVGAQAETQGGHGVHTDHTNHSPVGGLHPSGHSGHGTTGALGAYPMSREASGTSWQPDAASHDGVHGRAGEWSLMGHANLQGVYSSQQGLQGDDKGFLAGMVMGSARRDFANGDTLQLRGMASPDPFMGKRGYPLLLASGETADGVEPLIDRQHPHDLFMELSASFAHRLGSTDSVFVYVGLPGEPAFGPPAFMHRGAVMDSPEAPISHHWLDSTHITFGVVTAGWIHGPVKIEASRFRGREPDQDRFDIETGELDSTSVRASWNPTETWSLQASWADITSPEQLEPDEDEVRWSASALYSQSHAGIGRLDGTVAWGRKERSDGESLDTYILEAALRPDERWTLFGRAESIESDEIGGVHHGPVERAAKVSIGVIHDWAIREHVKLGIGALASQNFVSGDLEIRHGGDPSGAMAFIRLKVG